MNASVGYRVDEHWKAQLNLDNLLDEEYLAASLGRQNVYPGTPFNARLTITHSF
ncbi:MAG TPA: hypothetical protein VGD81_17270 [Opitutaceae bacterium]